jgi:hypothetical protein
MCSDEFNVIQCRTLSQQYRCTHYTLLSTARCFLSVCSSVTTWCVILFSTNSSPLVHPPVNFPPEPHQSPHPPQGLSREMRTTIPASACKRWGKPRKLSVTIAGLWTEIWTRDLLNTNQFDFDARFDDMNTLFTPVVFHKRSVLSPLLHCSIQTRPYPNWKRWTSSHVAQWEGVCRFRKRNQQGAAHVRDSCWRGRSPCNKIQPAHSLFQCCVAIRQSLDHAYMMNKNTFSGNSWNPRPTMVQVVSRRPLTA